MAIATSSSSAAAPASTSRASGAGLGPNGATSTLPGDEASTTQGDATMTKSTPSGRLYALKVESDAEDDVEAGDESMLVIDAEDSRKLSVVIRAFAPELLKVRPPQGLAPTTITDAVEPRRRGAERRARATETLDDLLFTSKLTVRKLREHFHKLQAPLVSPASLRVYLSGSHVQPLRESVDADRRRLAAISTCLTLVDEIARRARDRLAAETARPSAGAPPQRKRVRRASGEDVYALHMRLPGADYFTNAISLSVKDAAELDTAYADLISVQAVPLAPHPTLIPTLGERLRFALAARTTLLNAPGSRRRRDEDEYAKPVSHLYYGPWTASSGPAYDSFDGQLNYHASCALWRAKRRDRLVLHKLADARPSTLGLHARDDFKEALGDIFEGDDDVGHDDDVTTSPHAIDIDAILTAYDALPDTDLTSVPVALASGGVDSCLQHNAKLLYCLQELQEQRWQQLLAKSTRNVAHEARLSQPDENETAIAGRLLDSLADLLAAQPRADTDGPSRSAIPSADQLQSIATSAVVDPALTIGTQTGTWGTLDETLFGPSATRRQALARSSLPTLRPPSALRDNETLRLTVGSEEKATTQTIALTGATLGVDRDRGKGLLDRFADTRTYTLADHPHDRKPPVPPPAALLPIQQQPQHSRITSASPSGPRPGPGRPPYASYRTTGTTSYAAPPGQTLRRPTGGVPQQQQHQQHPASNSFRPPSMTASPHYR